MQFDQLKRREFITLLGGAAAAWPMAAGGQQSVHVVGVLASQPLPPVQRFVRKLREYGYVEGENLRLQSRFAEGHDDRYPDMADELIKLPVEVIVTWGTPAAIAAKQASRTVPIVMGSIGDPVSVGIVPSLAPPAETSPALQHRTLISKASGWSCLKTFYQICLGLVFWRTRPIHCSRLDCRSCSL
jgi:hypothetical protein